MDCGFSQARWDDSYPLSCIALLQPQGRDPQFAQLRLSLLRDPTFLNAGDVLSDARVWKGRSQQVSLGVLEDVVLTLPRSTANLTTEIIVDDPLIVPLAVGDVVGRVMLSRAGELVTEVPLQTLEAVEPAGFFARLWDSIVLWFQQLPA